MLSLPRQGFLSALLNVHGLVVSACVVNVRVRAWFGAADVDYNNYDVV